ncbi:MAG: hypothetical protein J6T34_05685, partial [Bacilli bacterium]|nr:hypothetical protein [Bacilli bacterium]
MANFLDYSGLQTLWGRIKQKFIQQPDANSVTAGNIATFTSTTVGSDTIIGVQDSGFTIATSVPSNAVFTDEHTTKAGHYDATAETYTPTANNTNLAWEAAVITGISKDSKGHITEVFTTKLPANPVDPNTITSSDTLTADKVILGAGSKGIKVSTYELGGANFEATPSDTTLATEQGVTNYVNGAVAGLAGAMHFVGVTTDTMADLDTTNPTVSGVTSFSAGDVVIDSTETEFVFGTDSKWHKLGDAQSYALANNVVNSWVGTGDSYITVAPTTTAARGNVQATISHNTQSGLPSTAVGTNSSVPVITVDAAGHVTVLSSENIAFPVTTVAGKTGAVVLDKFKVGTKDGNSSAVDVVEYDGNGAKGLYFSSTAASETNVQFAVDANGVVTGTVSAAATPGNGALKVQGTSGAAQATGFTANSQSDATITFAKSGDSISEITANGSTVTIVGVDSLKNPNALNVSAGAYSGTAGALTDGYDGSATKSLIFDNTTAAAPANASSTGNVQFTVATDGHIKGEFKLPENSFKDTTYTAEKGIVLPSGSTTFKAALVDETANSASSSKSTSADGGFYAIELDKDGKLAVRVPWTDHNIVASGFSAAGEADDGEHSGAVTASIVNMEGTTIINTISGQIPVATTSTSGVMTAGMKT